VGKVKDIKNEEIIFKVKFSLLIQKKIIMKRVRIMLAAIAVLGTVGGTLAFKAKRPNAPFCIRATTLGAGVCTGALTNGLTTTNDVDRPTIFYRPTVNRIQCALTNCTSITRIIPE